MNSKGTKNVRQNTYKKSNNKQFNNSKNSYLDNKATKINSGKLLLIPLIIVLCIIPFIVRLKFYNTNMSQFSWFSSNDTVGDIFLYYKQFAIIMVSVLMAIIIIYKVYFNRKEIQFIPLFIPLAVYAILALLSAILSKYSSFSFTGSFEQFESVFTLLGYCIIAYYAFLFVKSEKDLKIIIIYFLISVIIMGVLGVFQFLGYDFINSKLGYQLIIPNALKEGSKITLNFPAGRVYLTLFNPNYVGVYVALIAPLIMVLLFFQKKIINVILLLLSLIGMIISMIGSQSLAGFMGFSSAVICIIIFMWRYLLKRYYLVIPVFLVLMISLFVLNKQTNGLMINRITAVLHMQKSEIALTDIQTNNDNVSLTYNGNQMYVTYNKDVDKNKIFSITDTNNQSIPYDYDTATLTYPVKDERFPGMVLGENQDNPGVFYISVDGKQYYFTNQYGDLTYYYINHKDKIDKMVTAPAAIFNDYESFASGRGYIWSRTIPLLKKYIILGAGPDTFTMAFPQQDYLGLDRNGFADNVLTKPHSLYLQIGVQTGVLSLIAFLVFYFMYFASSFKIYIKGRFNSFYAQVGVAIFIGTIAYMITGLTNDSSITTAPIFWTLIGIGIAVNYKAKPLILEEETAIKAMKEKNNS